jgi:bifunctional non-homologous end joining protein LigD
MLPHVAHRPLSIVRCPHGEGQPCFFQKHPDAGTPKNLRQVPIQEKSKRSTYVVAEKPDDLVALVQVGALEIHAWGSKIDKLEQPDRLIFDLDPDPSVAWKQVLAAAGQVREFLAELGLQSFVKTTGGKGLHLVVPIQRRQTWPDVKKFCRAVADAVVQADPRRYTANMSKAVRTGKIFIDYLRNERGATAIVPYSTRARPQAPISVPLAWDELDPKLTSDHFQIPEVVSRLAKLRQDPWHDLPRVRQTLTRAAQTLLGAAAQKEN